MFCCVFIFTFTKQHFSLFLLICYHIVCFPLLKFLFLCDFLHNSLVLLITLLLLPPFYTFPEFRSPSHGGNLNRSASLSCTERAQESSSIGGSNTQIPGTPFQYIPDFSVRALADLQFVMVTLIHQSQLFTPPML